MNRLVTRTALLSALVLTPLAASPAQSSSAVASPRRSAAMTESFLEVLEQSQKSGKGVMVYMGHHAIGGAVTKIGEHTVELRSREYGRIVLRLERIDGVAGN